MAPAPSIVTRFGQWLSRISPSWRRDPRHRLGWRGEREAARFLKRSGYRILYRQYRPPNRKGEVDLICRDGKTLVFIEVKTRANDAYGRPSDAVDKEKERLVVQGALAWLRLLDRPDVPMRFDIVEVLLGETGPARCNLIKNGITVPEHYLF